jgi:hypothetical protein
MNQKEERNHVAQGIYEFQLLDRESASGGAYPVKCYPFEHLLVVDNLGSVPPKVVRNNPEDSGVGQFFRSDYYRHTNNMLR